MSLFKSSWPRYVLYGIALAAIIYMSASLWISQAVLIEYNHHTAATDLKTLQTDFYLKIFGGLCIILLALFFLRVSFKRFGDFIDVAAILVVILSTLLVSPMETGTIKKSATVRLGSQSFLIPYTLKPYSRGKPLLEGTTHQVEIFALGNFLNRPQFFLKTNIDYSSIEISLDHEGCGIGKTDILSRKKSSNFTSDNLCYRVVWHDAFDETFVKGALQHDKQIISETVSSLREP